MGKRSASAEQKLRLEWRDVSELEDNPANWREHPAEQTETIGDLLQEVGWAGALLYNERTGHLIDGHDRKKAVLARAGELGTQVPVLIGAWSEDEEATILASLDPVSTMATTNQPKLMALIAASRTQSPSVKALFDKLQGVKAPPLPGNEPPPDGGGEPVDQADTQATIGAFRFTIDRDRYEAWLEDMRQDVGFDDEAIIAEIRRRLNV